MLVDTAATAHILNDEGLFSSFGYSFQPDKHFITLVDGSRVGYLVNGKGKANVTMTDSDGCPRNAALGEWPVHTKL